MFEFARRRSLSRSLLTLAVMPCIVAMPLQAQATLHISSVDCTRIREAFHLASALGDRIWPTWHDAPFALLLVTPDYEFLVHHSSPTPEFTRAGSDTLVGTQVFYRKRVFSTAMQATFPAVNGVNTVVIGQAELTGDKTSTRWVLTVLHEHFHQLVYSAPGYYADVAKLGLAHGDETGMWMLSYPFPYDSARAQEKFVSMSHSLLDALAQVDERALQRKTTIFARAQREFRESVPAEAAKYFDFQLWQEGVARYTELMLAELAKKNYVPLPEFSALPDFTPYGTVGSTIRNSIMTDLGALSLAKARRIVVYSVGAAEALLLDRVRPEWKRDFLMHRFRLPDAR
jgi:hypothetical protein